MSVDVPSSFCAAWAGRRRPEADVRVAGILLSPAPVSVRLFRLVAKFREGGCLNRLAFRSLLSYSGGVVVWARLAVGEVVGSNPAGGNLPTFSFPFSAGASGLGPGLVYAIGLARMGQRERKRRWA